MWTAALHLFHSDWPLYPISDVSIEQWEWRPVSRARERESGRNAEWFSRILEIMLWIINGGEDESAKKKKKKVYGKIT